MTLPSPAGDRVSPIWWLWLPLAYFAGAALFAHLDRPFYDAYIDGEQGVLELLQAVTTLLALIVALTAIPLARRKGRRWLIAYLALAALCCFYVTGEELSWGQTLFQWATPEGWAEINDQGETNLHNLGALGNEIPRHILSAAVLIGGLGVPLLALAWPRLRALPLAILLPPACLWLTALLSALGGLAREKGWLGIELLPHASEVQESFLFWFVLLYLVVLKRRIRAL